jgi:hypothetical protein
MASDNFAPAATPKVGFSPKNQADGGQRQKCGMKSSSVSRS